MGVKASAGCARSRRAALVAAGATRSARSSACGLWSRRRPAGRRRPSAWLLGAGDESVEPGASLSGRYRLIIYAAWRCACGGVLGCYHRPNRDEHDSTPEPRRFRQRRDSFGNAEPGPYMVYSRRGRAPNACSRRLRKSGDRRAERGGGSRRTRISVVNLAQKWRWRPGSVPALRAQRGRQRRRQLITPTPGELVVYVMARRSGRAAGFAPAAAGERRRRGSGGLAADAKRSRSTWALAARRDLCTSRRASSSRCPRRRPITRRSVPQFRHRRRLAQLPGNGPALAQQLSSIGTRTARSPQWTLWTPCPVWDRPRSKRFGGR